MTPIVQKPALFEKWQKECLRLISQLKNLVWNEKAKLLNSVKTLRILKWFFMTSSLHKIYLSTK